MKDKESLEAIFIIFFFKFTCILFMYTSVFKKNIHVFHVLEFLEISIQFMNR